MSGSLHSVTDVDWFSFNIASPETMSVSFEVGNTYAGTKYWDVSIQDSLGNVLAGVKTGKNVVFNTGINSTGTYYLVVKHGSSSLFNTDQYTFSSHHAYLDKASVPWLTTDLVLGRFAKGKKRAIKLYHEFVLRESAGKHRQEFFQGTTEGRILGDDRFSEKALAMAEKKYSIILSLEDVIEAVCNSYKVTINELTALGKTRPASEARATTALIVQEYDNLSLTKLGNYFNRDLATLSQAANRLRKRAAKDKVIRDKIGSIRKMLT